MTCAILVPPRGDVGVEATLLFGLSMPAGSETGSGFGLTEIGWFRALFPHAFRGRRLVNRDRFRAGGGQFERIGLPGLVVAPPDRRSCLCPYLLQEPGFEKLGYGPLRLGALWTRWPNQAMIIALRRSAQQHKLRVVEFDRHVWTLAFRSRPIPAPSLTRAPDRSDRRGEGFARDATAFADGHARAHTLSFERKASLFLERDRLKRPSGSRF